MPFSNTRFNPKVSTLQVTCVHQQRIMHWRTHQKESGRSNRQLQGRELPYARCAALRLAVSSSVPGLLPRRSDRLRPATVRSAASLQLLRAPVDGVITTAHEVCRRPADPPASWKFVIINLHLLSGKGELQASAHQAHGLQAGVRAEQGVQSEPPRRQALLQRAGRPGAQDRLHAKRPMRPLPNVCGARLQRNSADAWSVNAPWHTVRGFQLKPLAIEAGQRLHADKQPQLRSKAEVLNDLLRLWPPEIRSNGIHSHTQEWASRQPRHAVQHAIAQHGNELHTCRERSWVARCLQSQVGCCCPAAARRPASERQPTAAVQPPQRRRAGR